MTVFQHSHDQLLHSLYFAKSQKHVPVEEEFSMDRSSRPIHTVLNSSSRPIHPSEDGCMDEKAAINMMQLHVSQPSLHNLVQRDEQKKYK